MTTCTPICSILSALVQSTEMQATYLQTCGLSCCMLRCHHRLERWCQHSGRHLHLLGGPLRARHPAHLRRHALVGQLPQVPDLPQVRAAVPSANQSQGNLKCRGSSMPCCQPLLQNNTENMTIKKKPASADVQDILRACHLLMAGCVVHAGRIRSGADVDLTATGFSIGTETCCALL